MWSNFPSRHFVVHLPLDLISRFNANTLSEKECCTARQGGEQLNPNDSDDEASGRSIVDVAEGALAELSQLGKATQAYATMLPAEAT